MFLKFMQKTVCAVVLLVAYSAQSFSQDISGPLKFLRYSPGWMPIASYSGIKAQDFKKLIVTSFGQANFTFISTQEESNTRDYQSTLYKFSYSIEFEGKNQTVLVIAKSNGDIDRLKKCANCFLGDVKFADENLAKNLPWMLQYELSSKIFPDLDLAYERMKINGQKWMDQKSGFNYAKQWRGERNFSAYGNSYAGVEFAALKREVIQAYVNAGFSFSRESPSNKNYTSLTFSFPITEDKKDGITYDVEFFHPLNSTAICAPCEMTEQYSPYQRLPAMGVMAIADRFTLESRFLAARARALELVKSATTRYLRPRTDFVMPPKPLPLGLPLPPPLPVT